MYKMQRLEVSGAVRLIYRSLGVKGLKTFFFGNWGMRIVKGTSFMTTDHCHVDTLHTKIVGNAVWLRKDRKVRCT